MIKVKSAIVPKAYQSMAEAVTAAKAKDLRAEDSINGKVVTGYSFNGNRLHLHFDNGKRLIIYPGDGKVAWVVDEGESALDQIMEESCLQFEFQNGEVEQWDWKAVLEEMVGQPLVVSPSDQYLFVYTKERKEYMFSVLENVDKKGELFLYFTEA